jgi:RNA polymerase sigma-70 factor (ECF subfamily)
MLAPDSDPPTAVDGEPDPCPREALVPHLPDLERWCRRRTGDPEVAADVTQEVALIALLKLPRLRDPLRIRPWLFRIAQRKLVDELRRRSAVLPLTIDIAAPEPPPSLEELRNCPRRRQVREAVRRLPLFLRRPVRLHYYQGRSLREVARRLETSVNGIKSRLYRARHILRREAR